jgi:hypothetical protein
MANIRRCVNYLTMEARLEKDDNLHLMKNYAVIKNYGYVAVWDTVIKY